MNNSRRHRRLSAIASRKNSNHRRAKQYYLFLILFLACLGLVFARGGADFLFRSASAEAGRTQDSKGELSANVQKQIQTLAAVISEVTRMGDRKNGEPAVSRKETPWGDN